MYWPFLCHSTATSVWIMDTRRYSSQAALRYQAPFFISPSGFYLTLCSKHPKIWKCDTHLILHRAVCTSHPASVDKFQDHAYNVWQLLTVKLQVGYIKRKNVFPDMICKSCCLKVHTCLLQTVSFQGVQLQAHMLFWSIKNKPVKNTAVF